MKSTPVIMPVKDRLRLTRQTVDSLFKNTFMPFRLIIISDGSNDETNDYLKTLTDKAKVVFMEESVGVGAAKNAGMAVAGDAEFYYITDNDMYFLPRWLETLFEIVRRFPKVGVVGGRTHDSHKVLDVIGDVKFTRQQVGSSMLIPRNIWLDYGPFAHFPKERTGGTDTAFCENA